MVRTTAALTTTALLLAATSLGQATVVSNGAMTPQQEALKNVDMASFGVNEEGDDQRILWEGFGFNWNVLMFNLGILGCDGGPAHVPVCTMGKHGPPQHIYEKCNCAAQADEAACENSENGKANCMASKGYDYNESGEYVKQDTTGGENKAVGSSSVKHNWWMFVVGAAVVAMVGAAIVMRKRRNAAAAEEGLDGDASLSGAVNKRAALLAGGAAAGAGAAATMPQFLSVPSFRSNPSGLEVDAEGMVVEPPPPASNYMDMDNHVDSSQLPEGVEISESGNLEPYHGGSMA